MGEVTGTSSDRQFLHAEPEWRIMWKLIVSDIDGTLVGDGQGEGALNPEYYREIKRLREKGMRFAACSGRQRLSIARLFHPIADRILYACDGGSLVFDKDRLLSASTLPAETVRQLVLDAEKIKEMDIMLCGTKRAYCKRKESELYHWMVEGYGYDMHAVGNLMTVEDEIVKVSLYHKDRAEELTNAWFRPKWEADVKLTLAGVQWLDCVPKDAGKKSAVAFLQQHFHIRPEETLVFGDNQNDMEMFELAGKSYAVENARDEVREAADEVCGSYEKDGVLEVLREL